MATNSNTLKPIHPFPARMAPSMLWRRIGDAHKKQLKILDPMSGSGTTAVVSRLRGHRAIAFDSDPLALLIARAWSSDVDAAKLRTTAKRTLARAKLIHQGLRPRQAYPAGADSETCSFVRYWFDSKNRKQLAALAASIKTVRGATEKALLWCALSRLIVTKQSGVSLAMDVSHSRPHRRYDRAPIEPFDHFLRAVEVILKASPFPTDTKAPEAQIQKGDARKLPLRAGSIDLVITSPPYLNAIDYLRGHKLSLVWMGHQVHDLRALRACNIGTELASLDLFAKHDYVRKAVARMVAGNEVSNRINGMLSRYTFDMNCVLAEIARVLKTGGEAVVVVGDSTIRGVYVRNSRALSYLGQHNGLRLRTIRRRPLKENRRYLPPPQRRKAGSQLQARMREEAILVFEKPNATLANTIRGGI